MNKTLTYIDFNIFYPPPQKNKNKYYSFSNFIKDHLSNEAYLFIVNLPLCSDQFPLITQVFAQISPT